jgi:hypothetical protein
MAEIPKPQPAPVKPDEAAVKAKADAEAKAKAEAEAKIKAELEAKLKAEAEKKKADALLKQKQQNIEIAKMVCEMLNPTKEEAKAAEAQIPEDDVDEIIFTPVEGIKIVFTRTSSSVLITFVIMWVIQYFNPDLVINADVFAIVGFILGVVFNLKDYNFRTSERQFNRLKEVTILMKQDPVKYSFKAAMTAIRKAEYDVKTLFTKMSKNKK